MGPTLRLIPAGVVTIRDRGRSQKLSPTSPAMPLFSRQHAQARRAARVVEVAPFWLGRTAITNAQYGGDDDLAHANEPVVNVSWLDAVHFCNRLSAAADLAPAYVVDGDDVDRVIDSVGYRLPSEAEWQRACVDDGPLDEIAWTRDNAGDVVHDVAQKRANTFGVYDLLGNVWEWCEDLFDPEVYGSYRVFRGGGFSDDAAVVRADVRRKSHPTLCIDDVGFRVARSHAGPEGGKSF